MIFEALSVSFTIALAVVNFIGLMFVLDLVKLCVGIKSKDNLCLRYIFK